MKLTTTIITMLAAGTMFATAADEKDAALGTKPTDAGKPKNADTGKPGAEAAKPAVEGEKKRDPEALFKKLDTDGDGAVSLEEFKAGPMGKKDPAKAEEMFKKKDKDGDGKLTLEEFKAAGGKKNK